MRLAAQILVAGLAAAAVAPAAPPENRLPDSVEAVLSKAERVELLSLEPGVRRSGRPKTAFHGWEVLGRVTVKDPHGLIAAVRRGVAESDGSIAMCFEPRHGLKVSSSKASIDLVICFECSQVKAFVDGKEVGGALTSSSPADTLNAVLRDAKVPLGSQ